ncbi:MAG: PfkB family carbohydrate kinase [Ginsengibacter sp.]
MAIISVGTMAFDAIETPFGKIDKIVGGSATYVAYAASHLTQPVRQVSIVGDDFPEDEMKELTSRGVEISGVEIVPGKKSFFWSGKYHLDMNTRDTLITDLNVLADFDPKIPDEYQGSEFLMLGNLMPAIQISVIKQLTTRPKLIVLDTMNFWMESAMDDLKTALTMIDVLMINDSEARQLSGEHSLVKAAKKVMDMGPRFLIIKKGEHGALLFHENHIFFAPALPLEDVFDPTGAGDAFAGGFIGHIDRTKNISFENLKTAIIVGSTMASFCVEKFGPQRLKEITKKDIDIRLQEFVQLVNFDIDVV